LANSKSNNGSQKPIGEEMNLLFLPIQIIYLTFLVVITYSTTISAYAGEAVERYPTRPIRVVNPYAPGGITDIAVRNVTPLIAQAWGQQIVVDNRPGAGTNIGTEIVIRAQADGYTLLANTGAISTNPSFYPNLPFKATRDLSPVVLIAETPGALAIQLGLNIKNLHDFISLAKLKPNQLTLASAGTGTSTHLAIELLKSMAKIDVIHIPFKGGGGGVVGVIGGQLSGIMTPLTLVFSQHQAGKLRVIGVTTPNRSPLAMEIPTFHESGVHGYEATSWIGLFAPRAIPNLIIKKWNEEVNRVIRETDVQERFKLAGLTGRGGSDQEFATYFIKDTERWASLIKKSNISIAP